MNNAFNLHKQHPAAPRVIRPLVAYDLVLMMEPATIAGAVLGSLLNKTLPEPVITVLLAVVLSAVTVRTLRSAQSKWAAENVEMVT